MFQFSVYLFVLCATILLTSNMSNASEDKSIKNINNATLTKSPKNISVTQKLNLTPHNVILQQFGNDQHMIKNSTTIFTEGESINPSQTSVSKLMENEPIKISSKIIPRKGAKFPENVTSSTTARVSSLSPIKVVDHNVTANISETSEKPYDNNTLTQTEFSKIVNKNTYKEDIKNQTKYESSTIKKVISTTIAPKPRKSKPRTTASELEDDEPIRSSTSIPTGRQNKIDFILPVIVAIVTLPLLSIFIYILYKRGRDCWDRRHYRRMDFLIDGMYNE